MNIDLLKQELTRDEGRRSKVYNDSLGIPTAGIGRNMRDVGLSNDEIDLMFSNDVANITRQLDQALPWWKEQSEQRQRALVNMGFMGVPRLLGFKKMLAAMQSGDYQTAAAELLDSTYAKQVGDRAKRLADMMRTG